MKELLAFQASQPSKWSFGMERMSLSAFFPAGFRLSILILTHKLEAL
jgi:hypothetical protein